MPDVELVDYGGGNLGSLRRCLHRLEIPYRLVDADRPPSGNFPLVLPGVGAFGAVAQALIAGGLDQRVCQLVKGGTPFLGICVGLQILLDSSQESPGIPGFGLIPGEVVRFQAPKVPQIGWNRIQSKDDAGGFVYFVNSYYAAPSDPSKIWYEADYHGRFCAALRDVAEGRHVSAFQFHPEKSGEFGHALVRRWYDEVKRL